MAPRAGRADALVEAIQACGEILAPVFPAGEDNPNEIPDRPRIRA